MSRSINYYAGFKKQLEVVRKIFASDGYRTEFGRREYIAAGPSEQAPMFAYQRGHILVGDDNELVQRTRDAILDAAHLGDGDVRPADPERRRTNGVTLLDIGERSVVDTLEHLVGPRSNGTAPMLPGHVATPNHVIAHCPGSLCRADEPFPADCDAAPIPAARAGNAGAGVKIRVIDSGLVDNYIDGHPWLAGVVTNGPGVPLTVTGEIPEFAGHGTFVAGVLRCMAPGADVHVANALRWGGCIFEHRLVDVLNAALDAEPDIINLSAGGMTHNGITPHGLYPFMQRLRASKTVLVAAVGNDGSEDLFWPAAFAAEFPEAVVSVGALREDGQGRACFSNYGPWVKVFAPGERLVNAFGRGRYRYLHAHSSACRFYSPPLYQGCSCVAEHGKDEVVEFAGMARWSGTSFAAPLVAGAIAARMSRTGETSRQAAAALVNSTLPVSDLSALLPLPEKV